MRWGSSPSGKRAGELDMLIETPDNSDSAVIEALNLTGFDSNRIESHFKKIFDYDAGGLENNYILVYAGADDFDDLWRRYVNYLAQVDVKYKLTSGPEEEQTRYADIKLACTGHNRHNSQTAVYHIFVNMKI